MKARTTDSTMQYIYIYIYIYIWKKVKERRREKQEGGSRSDEQRVRDRSHSIPTNSPSVYRGKAEGIERKGSPTLLNGKSNVTDSEY